MPLLPMDDDQDLLSLYPETTISFDYGAEEVVVYTTQQDVYEGLLAKETRPKRKRPLNPGYEVIYHLSDCRSPLGFIK